jgi:hypothetical protein
MNSPQLYVVFYRPRYGNYQHWALYIDDGEDGIIFEVVGSHPNFRRNVVHSKPEKSRNFLNKIYVGPLSKDDIKRVENAVRTVYVDNETVEWDCQEYVLDILQKLEDEFIVEEDDEDYQEAKKELKKKRGPTN